MAIDIQCQRERGHLVPETAYDAEQLDRLPFNKTLRCKVTMSRSDRHQRFYWAMLAKVSDNTEIVSNSDELHDLVRLLAGYVRLIEMPNGDIHRVPRSTSYGAMDQAAFKEYVDRAKDVICTHILPGTTIEEIIGAMGDG